MSGLGISPLLAALALAGTVGAVVALYLLHPPARRLTVPSTLIWERVLRGSRRRKDRLRWWLSLLLACAIALLLATSLLRHAGQQEGVSGERLVIVVDNSPTMASRSADGLTRFAHAKAGARALLSALPERGRAIVVDTQRSIALPRFEDRKQALATLDRISIGQDLAPRVMVPDIPAEATLQVFTDGVLMREVPAGAQVHGVFERVENLGITRFDVRAVPGQPGRQEAFVEVSNAGASDQRVELTLGSAKGVHERRMIAVPAGGKITQTLDASLSDSGPIRVALVGEGDALAADDAVYGYLPRSAIARLTLVTDSNPYLEKSLAAQRDVRLTVVSPARFREQGAADVYVFDRYAPSRTPAVPALLIRTSAADWPPVSRRESIAPQVAGWDAGHPVLQHLSLGDLQVQRAQSAPVAGGQTRVLLRSSRNEALIAADEREPRRVWLAFSLADSNFALQADFPMFLSNAIAWLTEQSTVVTRRVGRIKLPQEEAKVIGMDGAFLPAWQAGGELRFEALEPGIYTALSPRGNTIVAINWLSPQLTQVNESGLDRLPTATPAAAQFAVDPWPAVMLAALILLVLEWVTYHRRLTV